MGAVNTTYTFTATDTITSAKMNNIIDQTTVTDEAIIGTTLEVASGKLKVRSQGITSNEMAANSVTSTNIVDGTIVNADINASAAIAGTKVSPAFGAQSISGNRITITQADEISAIFTDSVNSTLSIKHQSPNNLLTYATDGAASQRWVTNGVERMRITADGNVGIGTATPNLILHTYGDGGVGYFESSTNMAYMILVTSEGEGNRVEIANRSGGRMALYNPTSGDVVNVLQNGNVGIGTTSPSTRLDVNGTVTATAFSGPLTGNVTGNVTGSASTVSNGAITASKLDGAQSGDAPIYGCRAWVSFAGRSTNGDCTIRSAGNVYRVARTAEGRYTVYFTTAMQDAEYATITGSDANAAHKIAGVFSQAAGSVDIAYSQIQTSTSRIDPTWGQVSIFR
jgi:hypothetical protein